MRMFEVLFLAVPFLLAVVGARSVGGRDVAFSDPAGKAWLTVDHARDLDTAAPAEGHRLRPEVDTESLLRNPATGWMLYDDASGAVARADEYWKAMDEAARKHASIFYLRWRWAEAEPEEGRYAWLYDPNFKALIEGARQRHLRLAFRFYVNSQDNIRQATPDYVHQAGAEGVMEDGAGKKLWTPYADDPVFQKKLSAFVSAFAKEFDDPARVDFVDALGLGWWGEGHHIQFKNPANSDQVLRWILDTYSKSFHHVLLGWQFDTTFGMRDDEDLAIKGEDYVYRRDGLGSHWFSAAEKAACLRLFPRHPLYAERCYWAGDENTPAWAAKQDPEFGSRFKSWHDMDSIAIDQGLEYHANTLDLRTVTDVKRFLTYPELIEKFTREGGYRLAPVEVACPEVVKPGDDLVIRHAWVNLGVGVLPDYNRRWGQKYRPAFALLANGATAPDVRNTWIASDAEPGDWLRGSVHAYTLRGKVAAETPPGRYKIVCGILNTRADGGPDLQLAIKSERIGSWHVIGKMEVKR